MNIGDVAPEFSLPDLGGRLYRLQDLRGRVVILNFWSCECPHAARTDALLTAWGASWGARVVLLPIACNANEPPDAIRSAAERQGLPVVLIDADRAAADLFGAQTTPHIFVIDAHGLIRYTGAVDDVDFGRRVPQRYYVQEAVQAILDDVAPSITTTRPYGCAIVRHALE